MKRTIQNKLDELKALSKKSGSYKSNVHSPNNVKDNLSKAIRTERDAEIFIAELNNALKSARNV